VYCLISFVTISRLLFQEYLFTIDVFFFFFLLTISLRSYDNRRTRYNRPPNKLRPTNRPPRQPGLPRVLTKPSTQRATNQTPPQPEPTHKMPASRRRDKRRLDTFNTRMNNTASTRRSLHTTTTANHSGTDTELLKDRYHDVLLPLETLTSPSRPSTPPENIKISPEQELELGKSILECLELEEPNVTWWTESPPGFPTLD